MYLKEFMKKLNKCPFREFTFCWKHFFPVWNLFTPMCFYNKYSRRIIRCIDDISLWQLCFSRTQYSLYSVSSLCFWSCGLICWLIWLLHSFTGNLLFQVLSSYSKLHCDPENPLCLFYSMSEFVVCCLGVLWKLQALKKSPLGHDCDVPGASVLPQPLSPMKSLLQCKETVKHLQDNGHLWVLMMSWYPRRDENGKRIRTRVALFIAPTPCTHTMHPHHTPTACTHTI